MRRLSILACLLALAACEGAVRDPTGLGGGGGNLGGGGGGSGPAFVGSWEATFIFQTSQDLQRHTTRWTFGAGGGCQRVSEIYSVLEDRTFSTGVHCTWQAGTGVVLVSFDGNPAAVSFRWTLEHFSPDRLVLDGVPYDRIG